MSLSESHSSKILICTSYEVSAIYMQNIMSTNSTETTVVYILFLSVAFFLIKTPYH